MTIKNKTEQKEFEPVIISSVESPEIPEEARRHCLEALPRLRAHREAIRTRRGGEPIDIEAAIREARAAHERGE